MRGARSIPPEIEAIGGPPTRVKDSRFWLFGLMSSPSHMSDWRRMQFLLAAEEVLSSTRDEKPTIAEKSDIRVGAGRAAGRASMFIPQEGVHRFSEPVQRLSRLIGSQNFQAIYNAAPPEALVEYMISPENQKRYNGWSGGAGLEQITVEVLHGRLPWEERFAAAGVPTPDQYLEAAEKVYDSPGLQSMEGWV
jgi:hypothetical protein